MDSVKRVQMCVLVFKKSDEKYKSRCVEQTAILSFVLVTIWLKKNLKF